MKITSSSKALYSFFLIFSVISSAIGYKPAQATSAANAGFRIVSSSDQDIRFEFESPSYELNPVSIDGLVYEQIKMDGSVSADQPGQPQLPIYTALVGIPGDAVLSLSVLSDQTETIPLTGQLLPSQSAKPIQEDLTPGEKRIEDSSGVLAPGSGNLSTGAYPASPVSLSGDAWLRDQRLVRITIYPIQFESSQSALIWHRSFSVQIGLAYSSKNHPSQANRTIANPFEQVLQASLINYQEALKWRTPDGPVTSRPASNSDQPVNGSGSLPQTLNATAQTKYRISINQDGLYRLTYENLKLAGVPVDTLNVANSQLSSQGRQVDFYFEDHDANQVFGAGDALLFYGQKFYGDWMAQRYVNENVNWTSFSTQLSDGSYSTWTPSMNATMLEKYTDENVYWLVLGSPGLQMKDQLDDTGNTESSQPAAPDASHPSYLPLVSRHSDINPYRETVHAEQSHRWKTTLFTSEDTWFWDEIQTSSSATRSYPVQLSTPLQDNSQAKLSGELVAAAYNDFASPDHHILVYLNDPSHLQTPILDATWDGKSRYHFDVNVSQSRLVNGTNNIDLVVEKTAGMTSDDIFVDWFQIEYNRPFMAIDNKLSFSDTQVGQKSYRVTGFTAQPAGAFDITNPLQPLRIVNYSYSGGTARFSVKQTAQTRYTIGLASSVLPAAITAFTPVDYSQPADYIFITHKDFRQPLQQLVDFRAGQGFKTLVINVDDLYNQFNDGIYNPIAIKNFLAYTFQTWSTPPTYVLLVGDGHWNFKGYPDYDAPPIYMPPFLSWVDPWQGEVDSANLLGAVVGNDPLADVMIGRMPVNNAQQLSNIISKTIAYDPYTSGAWKKHMLFIADNPDAAGDFVAQSDALISSYVPAGYTADKIYLPDFLSGCVNPPPDGYHQCPAVTQAIIQDLNQKGAFIATYTGHASLNLWANEGIFTNQDISSLTNAHQLPIILSMDCLDGYWIHPNVSMTSKAGPGLIEEILRADGKGAVAAFSPTGLGVGAGHDTLAQGFLGAVFQSHLGRLGEAAAAAKLNLYNTGYNLDLVQTYTIFGDPALKLNTP